MLLPRGYLSHSAITCFKTNKARFVKEYLEGGKKLHTKYMDLGKTIAKMIEQDKHHDILPGLPVYELREHEIRVEIAGVPILCYLDDCKADYSSFRDKKSGLKPWSQTKAQKSEQLLLYATAIRAKYGVTPKTAYIDWLETTMSEEECTGGLCRDPQVLLTGRYESYERRFDIRELDRMEKEIAKVAVEIEKFYGNWLDNQLN